MCCIGKANLIFLVQTQLFFVVRLLCFSSRSCHVNIPASVGPMRDVGRSSITFLEAGGTLRSPPNILFEIKVKSNKMYLFKKSVMEDISIRS